MSGKRRNRAFVALFICLALIGGACGDDDDDEQGAGTTQPAGGPVRVTLTQDAITMPETVTGGIVTVEFDSQIGEGDIDFTRVTAGTTEQQFKEGVVGLLAGGPVPAFFETNVGITAIEKGVSTQSVEFTPGSYIAWAIPEEPEEEGEEGSTTTGEGNTTTTGRGTTTTEAEGGEEEGPPPEAVVTKPFTVSGTSSAQLPATDGTVTAKEYTFDLNVKAGEKFTFRNDGPNQLHHAVIFNFAKIDPKVVEEKLVGFLQAEEDAPPPPEFASIDLEKLEAGSSGVFSPGLEGTFSTKLEAGNTYAVVCFIHDRTGGAPHVFANQMYKVFTVA